MTQNPFQTAFELQRQSIAQSLDVINRGLEIQQSVSRTARTNLEVGRSFQQRGTDLSKQALHAYVDAFAATTLDDDESMDDVHQTIDDQFEVFEETTDETWDAFERAFDESVDAYNQLTEVQRELLNDSTDAFLESYEEVESQTIELTDADEE